MKRAHSPHKIIIALLALALMLPMHAEARKKSATSSKTTTTKTTGGKSTAKSTGKSTGGKSTGKKGQKPKPSPAATSSRDAQRQHDAATREIKLTEQQIKENEAQVKKSLSQLGALQTDIDGSKQKVAQANAKVTSLQNQINTLNADISKEEQQLSRLRAEYLKAVKAMRSKRKEKSLMAFIFSSSSFNEAMRRMRYLKEFSTWREKQTGEITAKVAHLKKQTELLAGTKAQHDRQLAVEVKARDELQKQYTRQDAIVVELKKNGQALRSHLAKKQAEANALKGQVAQLIAEETRKAEAERAAREKQVREAQAKAAREREAQARAQREREAAEREAAEREALLAQQNEQASQKQAKQQKKEAQPKQEPDSKQQKQTQTASKPAKEKPAKQQKQTKPAQPVRNESEVSYAEARRRKPKGKDNAPAQNKPTPPVSTPPPTPAPPAQRADNGSFASMRGALPRPVSGAFKVTSRFGRQTLPDMPDVSYDNPGIDAEVSPGASAKAVYGGKVSGVYMVPGYNTVVIVSHGDYYTVYGHLAQAGVKTGDSVKQGQTLGSVAIDDDDSSVGSLHFEVWHNRDKLDPLGWIR